MTDTGHEMCTSVLCYFFLAAELVRATLYILERASSAVRKMAYNPTYISHNDVADWNEMTILDTHRQIVGNPARLVASWSRLRSALAYEDAELLIKKLAERLGCEEWSIRHKLAAVDRIGVDGCAYGRLDDARSIRIGRITYYPRCASKAVCAPGDWVVFAKESTVAENPPSGEVRRWVDFIRI